MFRKATLVLAAVVAGIWLYVWWSHIASGLGFFFGFKSGQGNDSHYLFWSGAGSDLAYLSFVAAAITVYRKHNCAMQWCPRIGKHEFTNPDTGVKRLLCWKHHPDVHNKVLTRDLIETIHSHQHRTGLYLGDKPGKG